MIKKIISVFLTVCMLVPCFSAAVFAEEAAAVQIPDGIELVKAIGIDVSENYADTVTRETLASAAAKFAAVNDAVSGNRYFTDVTSAQWQNGIGAAYLNGYMLGAGDKLFHPESAATIEEAAGVFLRIAGFSSIVKSDEEYMKYAQNYDLLDNVSGGSNSELTYGDLYTMIYNALFLPVVEITSVGTNSEYKINRDENLLGVIYDAYEGKGIVTANEFSGLSSADDCVGEGMIAVDNATYIDKAGAGKVYLAYNILFYYIESDNSKPVLIYARPDKKVDSAEYNLEDLSVSSGKIETDVSGRNKTIKISDYASYIINGCIATKAKVYSSIENDDGTATFIDNDGDGTYDVISVRAIEFMWVKNKINTDMILEGDDGSKLDLSGDNEEIITIYKNGETGDFSLIAHYDVLEIVRSGNDKIIDVYASAFRVLGTADSSDLEEGIVSIEGTEYKIPRSGLPGDFTVGKRGVFYISTSGYLAAAEMFEYEYGYILRAYESEDDEAIMIKVLNSLGETEYLRASDKCRYENTDTPLALDDVSGKKLIRYSCNSSGEVNKIAAAKNNTTGKFYDANNFSRDADAEFYVRTVNPIMISTSDTQKQYFVNQSTIIFRVPTETDAGDEDYKVVSSSTLIGDQKVTMEVYDSDKYSIPSVIVMKASAYENPIMTTSLFVLNKMQYQTDENGDIVLTFTGMLSNKEVSYTVSEKIASKCFENGKAKYRFGDIFQLKVDDDNKITQFIEIMVGDEKDTDWVKIQGATTYDAPVSYAQGKIIQLYDDRCLMFGYARNVKNVDLAMGIDINNPLYSVYRIAAMNKAVYTIVDYGERTITAGSAGDIGDGSLVLARSRRQDIGDIVILKNAR